MWSIVVNTFSYVSQFMIEYLLGKSLDQVIKRKSAYKHQIHEHRYILDIYGTSALKALIEENDLRRRDLADVFGTRAQCTEVLEGREPLTFEHIRQLSERFHISPMVFFPQQ